MKICLAQIQSNRGDIPKNIEAHLQWVKKAISQKADLIVFPELSLSGYEPQLAESLAIYAKDERLDVFQKMSDENQITICVGAPVKTGEGITISMIIFQPHQARKVYSKQHLHEDELPYFMEGKEEVFIEMKGHKITPAICYESMLSQHAEKSIQNGATLYLASVAKSKKGMEKALSYFPEMAKKHNLRVLLVNSVGPSEEFMGGGKTSVWNRQGKMIKQLNNIEENTLFWDTEATNIE